MKVDHIILDLCTYVKILSSKFSHLCYLWARFSSQKYLGFQVVSAIQRWSTISRNYMHCTDFLPEFCLFRITFRNIFTYCCLTSEFHITISIGFGVFTHVLAKNRTQTFREYNLAMFSRLFIPFNRWAHVSYGTYAITSSLATTWLGHPTRILTYLQGNVNSLSDFVLLLNFIMNHSFGMEQIKIQALTTQTVPENSFQMNFVTVWSINSLSGKDHS